MIRKYTSLAIMALVLAGAVLFGSSSVQAQAANAADSDVVKDWHGSLALGASLAKGNTDTLLLNATARTEKDWKHDEVSMGADGNYGLNNWGRSNETQSANNIHGFADYKRLFTDRFYGNLHLEGLHDDLADVRYRVIVGPGVGYYFIKTDVTRLNGDVGPSLVYERVGGVTQGYVVLRVAERGEHNLSKTSRIWEQVEFLPQVDDFQNYLLNSEVGAEAALNAHLALRVVAQDKYNNRPPPGIKSNDVLLVASVVWKFGPQ